jgi:hypothetical protein
MVVGAFERLGTRSLRNYRVRGVGGDSCETSPEGPAEDGQRDRYSEEDDEREDREVHGSGVTRDEHRDRYAGRRPHHREHREQYE